MYTVSFHNTQQVYTSYGEVKVKFLWEGKTIKGGKIWYSEFTGSWSGWSDVTSNVQNVGSGAIKCFNTYTDSDGYNTTSCKRYTSLV